MRTIGLILSFYLILLATIPCCAVDSCPDDKTEQTAAHEKGDEDCGSCSPFFSCEGCAAATIACQPLSFEISYIKADIVFTGYQQRNLPAVQYDFWQPPKLG